MNVGSSFAAGPGVALRATDRPRKAGQSRRNYPHLAERLDLDLVEATSKGATVVDVMTRSQFGQPPQIEAVTTSTKLVTSPSVATTWDTRHRSTPHASPRGSAVSHL